MSNKDNAKDQKLIAVATYGTLKIGGALCYPSYIICSSKDTVKGNLFNIKGAFFPGLHLGGDTDVPVEVQIITEDYWKYMVAVEGNLFKKREVITGNGVPVYIFEYVGEAEDSIESWDN